MKRMMPLVSLILILALTACGIQLPGQTPVGPTAGVATLPPDEILTIVSATLTLLPMATEEQPVILASATPELPTLPPVEATATSEPTVAAPPAEPPTATAVPPTATAAATEPAPTAAAPAGPTATVSSSDPRSRLGAPTSTDSMDDSFTWNWPVGSDKYTNGVFVNGTLAITTLDSADGWRMANPRGYGFNDIYLEATFKTAACSGTDHYGIILRVPVLEDPDQGYLFGVTCDGKYSLRRWDGDAKPRPEMKRLIDWTASSAINSGSNQTNRLGVWAVGNRLVLYINGTQVGESQDALFKSGFFGVFAGYDNTKNMVIQLDEMSYWENPK